MREMNIITTTEASLEPIFESLSLCASLHPDPNFNDDMNDDDDAFISSEGFEVFNGDENQELSEVGRVRSDFANDARFKPY
jgi:chloride channel, nucleotide-sensitive, 1A